MHSGSGAGAQANKQLMPSPPAHASAAATEGVCGPPPAMHQGWAGSQHPAPNPACSANADVLPSPLAPHRLPAILCSLCPPTHVPWPLLAVCLTAELVDLMSWLVIPAYDVALCYFGGRSLQPLAYLLLGLYFGVGLHPIAGHVISEHCSMGNDGQVRQEREEVTEGWAQGMELR